MKSKQKTIVQEAQERGLCTPKELTIFWRLQHTFRKLSKERKAKTAKKLSTSVKVDKKAR